MAEAFECKKWSVISHGLTCAPKTFSAGRNLGGGKQIRRLPNGYWRGPVTLNPIRKADMVDYRGWLASLEGSGEAFDLCICDPFALKGEGKTYEEFLALQGYRDLSALCGPINGKYGLPFSDGTCFSDGTGFYIPEFVLGATTAAAAHGATSIELNGAAGFLKRGNYFSTPENYLHVITRTPNSPTIEFTPPLRKALAVGAAIETQSPKIRVRLESDISGTAIQNYGRYTDETTLRVEEVLTR